MLLKELVKSLTIKCVGLMEQVKKLTAKVNQQEDDTAWYKNKIKEQKGTMEHLQEKAEDLERLADQMKEKQGVTEQLKSENQMQWVGMMNNIRYCAEEVVLRDIVYA